MPRMRKTNALWAILLSLILTAVSLGACALATPASPSTPQRPDAVYTAAAETIIAQLTQVSAPLETSAPLTATLAVDATPLTSPVEATGQAGASQPSETSAAEALAQGSETPTPTPPPSATPEPTATSVAGDPKLDLGNPTWRDTFNNTDSWPIYDDEHVNMTVQDSSLQMTLLKADKWNSWILTWPILRNFYLEVTAKPGDCAGTDNYGVLARAPSDKEAYLFGFTCDGKFSFRRWTGERFATNVDWTASEYILSGKNQANRLGLMANGTTISLYANGHLLTELRDANYRRGGIGLYASAFKTTNFLVRFQEVQYWELP
jgi:3-keto-disaccharide hydrolase